MIKPKWLKVKPPSGEKFQVLKKVLHENGLNTVCQSANCPNVGDCWSRGMATFMILGSICTRNCRFCAIEKGRYGEPLDPGEPERITTAVEKIGLKHVILTSVDRDDLIDGGSGHFADCIQALKGLNRNFSIEVLIPDFQGNIRSLQKVIETNPDIIGHNIETTQEFQVLARDRRSEYGLSLEVLKNIKQIAPSILTKSSLMLGFGETEEMVIRTMLDLRNAGVDMITLGQYLQPGFSNIEVKEYLPPEKFAYYKKKAKEIGYLSVVSGPLVRSSYSPKLI